MTTICSNCGARNDFEYAIAAATWLIVLGWGSYGGALYCPECTKMWRRRNQKAMASGSNTIHVIDELYLTRRKRR